MELTVRKHSDSRIFRGFCPPSASEVPETEGQVTDAEFLPRNSQVSQGIAGDRRRNGRGVPDRRLPDSLH